MGGLNSHTRGNMNKQRIFELIVLHSREVLPDLEGRHIQYGDSLKALGANSIDRSEIVMMTLSSLSANIPLMEFARAENIGGLVDIFHGKLEVA
jgi:polyketide biosynthesis acyl carrier protein